MLTATVHMSIARFDTETRCDAVTERAITVYVLATISLLACVVLSDRISTIELVRTLSLVAGVCLTSILYQLRKTKRRSIHHVRSTLRRKPDAGPRYAVVMITIAICITEFRPTLRKIMNLVPAWIVLGLLLSSTATESAHLLVVQWRRRQRTKSRIDVDENEQPPTGL